MKILKFGGSSLATPDNVRRAIAIVGRAVEESAVRSGVPVAGVPAAGVPAVVVSAFGGVTDDLLRAAETASRHDQGYREICAALARRHLDAGRDLAEPDGDLTTAIEERFVDLGDLLHGVYLLRECSPRARDSILSYGERLSAAVVAAAMRRAGLDAEACDARRLIVTDDGFGNARVDLEASYAHLRQRLDDCRQRATVAVVTGFLGATPEGQTTTLGRGGSDYTAALLGAAVDAEAIELWTDVDGVMSADPRLVADAFPQAALSYAELMELSHFGAEVVYPPSIHPARSRGIPLVIKNTFNPDAPGTRVGEETAGGEAPIRGISSINRVALMRLEGDGMVGVPGIAMRLFGALARCEVSVILISQGSSEHSICFAVAPEDAGRARAAVDAEFALERRLEIVDELVVAEDRSVIAAVGEKMRHRPAIAGSLFNVLGEHRVNVRAIAQGSSERNISLVVDQADEKRALNAIHGAFFAPGRRRVALALAGPGRVGATLLEQLSREAGTLREHHRLDLRLVAVADSRRMVLDGDGIDLETWRQQLGAGSALDAGRLRDLLAGLTGDLKIFVDCTASPALGEGYAELLEQGVAVVAANKLAFAGPLETYRRLRSAERRGGPLLFEATVGAGLPVLSTLETLRRTGHRIERVDGVLSGTVNAVLDRLAAGDTFSRAVARAQAEGLTEPHPYDDLSGADVARKLTILARLAGREIEAEEVEVEPLLPAEPWSTLDLEAFERTLPRLDGFFAERQQRAAAAGRRLRYVASLSAEGVRVALEAVAPEHPAYGVARADNVVAFTTQHYRRPLSIRGPGAGTAVTASGVFADILHAAARLGGS